MSLSKPLTEKASELFQLCRLHGVTLVTAESCTGGLVAAAVTALPGSSDVLRGGFVTYSNEAKTAMIGVPAEFLDKDTYPSAPGAVSAEVARAMAEGALRHSDADIGISITGIAGPTGGSAEKPVGTVHIAAAMKGAETLHRRFRFEGDRISVREQSALAAMELAIERICSFHR